MKRVLEMPKVSIIIPIFNAENFLEECLESVFNQSESSIEVILINDGSTDSSEEICKQYQNTNTNTKYVFQENAGASAARNHGIEIAKGEFIQFFDADDLMHSDMLATSLSRIEQDRLDILSFDFGRFKTDSGYEIGILEQQNFSSQLAGIHKDSKTLSAEQLVIKYGFGTPRSLYKRKAIGKTRFHTDIRNNEDHLFNYELLANGKSFGYLPKVLMYYRMHDSVHRLTLQSDSLSSILNATKRMHEVLLTLQNEKLVRFGEQVLANKLGHYAIKHASRPNKNLSNQLIEYANRLSKKNVKISRNMAINVLVRIIGLNNLLRIVLWIK